MQHYQGEIRKIIFQKHDSANPFFILMADVEGKGLISVKGNSNARLSEGGRISFSGSEETYQGEPQINAIMISPYVDVSARGARGWIRTLPVDGFGPKSAENLFKAFPDNLHEVLGEVDKLIEAGLSERVAEDLSSAWGSLTIPNEILETFAIEGLKVSTISRIVKTYGTGITEKLHTDPWGIAKTVHGVGFKTMDNIAQTLGVDMDSENRYQALLDHIMSVELSGEGHTQAKDHFIISKARYYGFNDQDRVKAEIEKAIEDPNGPLVRDRLTDRISHRSLHADEQQIMRNIRRLHETSRTGEVDAEEYLARIEQAERELGLTLDTSQREAALRSLQHPISIITGGPGTGKSTTQAVILRALRMDRQEVVSLTAPTGRAAQRLGVATGSEGMTIHRLLVVDPEGGGFIHNRFNPLEATTIIADEYSMVDTSLCRSLIEAIQSGGRLIIVGDDKQLPSVGQGQVLADLINSEVIALSRLNVIHRQAEESGIISAAHAMLNGDMPEFNNKDTFFWEAETAEEIYQRVIKLYETLPEHGFSDPNDIMVLSPQRKGDVGSTRLNEIIKEHLNPAQPDEPSHTITTKRAIWSVGDRVMQLRNCYDKMVFNGEIGDIVGVEQGEKSSSRIWIKYPDRENAIEYKDDALGELAHAWASTIHKVQGSEAPVAMMLTTKDHKFMLERCLVYTGGTRPKGECHYIGQKPALQAAIRKTKSTFRKTGLLAGLRADFGLEPKEEPKPKPPVANASKRPRLAMKPRGMGMSMGAR